MTAVLAFLTFLLCALIAILVPAMTSGDAAAVQGPVTFLDSSQAALLCFLSASLVSFIFYRADRQCRFVLRLFLAALLVRMLVGAAIFVFNGQNFFGGDALTYDLLGYLQVKAWNGDHYAQSLAQSFVDKPGAGWGMVYFVAAIYRVIGRNLLAVQLMNAVLGAATAPLIFLSARMAFENSRAARLAGMCVAFMPSLVLWSAQGLKDGPIMFFLALSILATLKLGDRFSFKYLVALAGALFCILAFRFYVFYMLAVAIGGAFVIGMQRVTAQGLVRQLAIMILLGLTLTYFGVTRYASAHLETYGALDAVQRSRNEASTSARSGFASEGDVSTAAGALSAVPLGLAYLLFAPFPWQLGSLRQAITLPEMLLWWASFPLLVLGLWFSIKYRLRQVLPILIFTMMLSLAYSIFQGNVGNAYRERAQLLMFYFIFVAVGYVLIKEKRVNATSNIGLVLNSVTRR